MAAEAPQVEKGLKLLKASDLIAKGIDIVTPEKTLDIFSSFFQYKEAPGYREGALHYLAQGYFLVGIFDHYVHFDGVACKIAAENIIANSQALEDSSKRIVAGYGLHQGTMESGAQGEELQTYTLKLEGAAEKRGLVYLPYTTKEHIKRYKIDKDPEKLAKVKQENDESIRKMKSAPGEQIALLLLPAGNMKSARDPSKGMVESDLTWITLMSMFPRNGVKIAWLPGVIQETFRISDPDTRNLTPEGVWSFARNLMARSSFPLRPSEAKIASLTMLPPYPIDRLAADLSRATGRDNISVRNLKSLAAAMFSNSELTDQLIMGTINDELPKERKGTYYKGYKSFGLGDYADTLYVDGHAIELPVTS